MSGQPTLLHVLTNLMPSGAERMLEAVGPMAVADGVAPAILSIGESGPGPFAHRLVAAGYAIHHVPFSRDAGFIRRLLRFFRRRPADVVHVHCERAAFWIALAARTGNARRIVRTMHGLFEFDGVLRVRRSLQRAASRRLLGVDSTALSTAVIENEWRRFGNPVRRIPAWVDPAFRPAEEEERRRARALLGLAPDTVAVAVVGNCAAVKNHDALIRAVARLRRDGADIRLLHAGHGALEAEERQVAVAEGVADGVRFLGAVDDVLPLLHAADAFAMPSLREGLGIAALEALACGLPAVLTDGHGLRDLRPFGSAVVWCGTDPDSISEALARIARLPPAERAALAAGAPDLVRQRHSAAAGWAAFRELYAWPTVAEAVR